MVALRMCKFHNTSHPDTAEYWRWDSEYYRCRQKDRDQDNRRRATHTDEARANDKLASRRPSAQYSQLKRVAKNNDREVLITKQEFITLRSNPCHYCGGDLPLSGYGLDRIDNSRGYSADNLVPCCTTCNLAKRTMSVSEFEAWIHRVYQHLTSRKFGG